jgi:hypothetical protein
METRASLSAKIRKVESKLIPEIYRLIEGKPIAEAINAVKTSFSEIPMTPFHAVAEKDFLPSAEALADHLVGFHETVSRTFEPAAIYCEMNGFTINPELWYLDVGAYREYGGLEDPSWLCHHEHPRYSLFELRGWEDVQKLYARYLWNLTATLEVRFAKTVAEFLIVLRFCELVAKAHEQAKTKATAFKRIPLLANAHDYDCLYESR